METSLKKLVDNYEIDEDRRELILLRDAKKKPDSVMNWQIHYEMSKNEYNKKHFLQQMMKTITRNGDIFSYSQGVVHTYMMNRRDLTSKLLTEAIEKHPVTGRVLKFIYYIPSFAFLKKHKKEQ